MKLGPFCFDEDVTLLFAWTIGKTVAKVDGPFSYAFTGLVIGEHMIGTMRRVRKPVAGVLVNKRCAHNVASIRRGAPGRPDYVFCEDCEKELTTS
jgi:hypothetical protein